MERRGPGFTRRRRPGACWEGPGQAHKAEEQLLPRELSPAPHAVTTGTPEWAARAARPGPAQSFPLPGVSLSTSVSSLRIYRSPIIDHRSIDRSIIYHLFLCLIG